MVSSFQTRRSMQARRSGDPSRHSLNSMHGDREGLIRAYDEEEAAGFGLSNLVESDDEGLQRPNGKANGKHYRNSIEMETRKPADR